MTLIDLLVETKLRVVLKTDTKLPPSVLKKIEETGLTGQELYHLKKTVLMQKDSGISEKDLLKFKSELADLMEQLIKMSK